MVGGHCNIYMQSVCEIFATIPTFVINHALLALMTVRPVTSFLDVAIKKPTVSQSEQTLLKFNISHRPITT